MNSSSMMVLSPSLSFKRNELKERGNIIAFESTYPQAKPPRRLVRKCRTTNIVRLLESFGKIAGTLPRELFLTYFQMLLCHHHRAQQISRTTKCTIIWWKTLICWNLLKLPATADFEFAKAARRNSESFLFAPITVIAWEPKKIYAEIHKYPMQTKSEINH